MPSQGHMRGGVMLIKFKARQQMKAQCQAYQSWLDNDAHLTADECEEIIDVITALETALSMLEEGNE